MAPETGRADARVVDALIRAHKHTAGVYGVIVRPGIIAEGEPVFVVDHAATA